MQLWNIWQIYICWSTRLLESIIYILTFGSKGKSESITPLFLLTTQGKRLFPPTVFGCCCPCSLCLTLSTKPKSLFIYLQALTGAAETLLCYSLNSILGPTESTFHCNINFLVSIRSNLTLKFMLKIFCVKIAKRGRRTLYSFYPVKHPHPLCLRCSVTGDLCEMQEKANKRINSKCIGRTIMLWVWGSTLLHWNRRGRNLSCFFSKPLAQNKLILNLCKTVFQSLKHMFHPVCSMDI